MDKKPYYVSVQAGTVLADEGAASFEFEIEATEQQVDELMESFGMLSDLDNSSARRVLSPSIPYHQDTENDNYDLVLTGIYRKLYELGTPETQQTIAGMLPIGEQQRPIEAGEADLS